MSLGYINGNLSEVPSAFGGETVNVGGVVYGWDDALGRYVPSTPLEWDTYALLVAAWPTALVGQKMLVKRIIGSGHYQVQWDGYRWSVVPGHSPVCLGSEVALTTSGTAYVQMASALVGPLIGDNETWVVVDTLRSGATLSAAGNRAIRLSGSVQSIGSPNTLASANRRGRSIGRFRRRGSVIQREDGQNSFFSSVSASDTAFTAATFTVECGVVPGASGDNYALEEFIVAREA